MNEISRLLTEFQIPTEYHKPMKAIAKSIQSSAELNLYADIADSLHTLAFVFTRAAEKYQICTEAEVEAAKAVDPDGDEPDEDDGDLPPA